MVTEEIEKALEELEKATIETMKRLEKERYKFVRSLVTSQVAFGAVLFGLSTDTLRIEMGLRVAAVLNLAAIFFGSIFLYENVNTYKRILNKIQKGQIKDIICKGHLAPDKLPIFYLCEWLFYLSSASILISLLLYVCY